MILAILLAAAPAQRTPQQVWEQKCKMCHGVDGKSQTKKGRKYKAPDFTTDKWQKDTTDEEIYLAIHDGVEKSKMPPFKGKLSEEEIQSMVPYLRAFAGKK